MFRSRSQVASGEWTQAIPTVSGLYGAIKRMALCREQGRETGPTNGSLMADELSH